MHMIRRGALAGFLLSFVIAIAVLVGVSGCGSNGDGSGGASSSIGGGVTAALSIASSAIKTSVGQSSTAPLVVPESGCITSEDSNGSLTSICTLDCEAGDIVQGSQTTTTILNYGDFTSCSLNGNSGMERDITGESTTAFTNCAVESCGQKLILNGSISGTLQITSSGCGYSTEITTNFGTSGSCSGLSIMDENGSSIDVGLQTISLNSEVNGLSQTTLSGQFCDNGNTTTFGSEEEFLKIVDPEGSCFESSHGGTPECDQCVNDCVDGAKKDGTTYQDAYPVCRERICSFICGDYDCSPEDDQKCRDVAGQLAPAGLKASYEAATKCSKFDAFPCLIACDQADPSDMQRCADITVNQIHTLVSPSAFDDCAGQSCYFPYACAGPDDFAVCPDENICTSSSDPNAYYCSVVRTCLTDSECGEGICTPLAGRDFSTCQCAPNDTDGCVLIP